MFIMVKVYTVNISEPIEKSEDESYQSGDYSLVIKEGYIYIHLGLKQVRKIKLEISKDVIRKYGYTIKEVTDEESNVVQLKPKKKFFNKI